MRTLTQPLNMSPGGIPPVIHVSQYDSDFTIVFTLFSTVGDFTIEAGTTAMVRGTKSSGTGYSADATINISAKTVTVTGNAQMTAAAGQNVFEITLLKSGKEISSKNFILLCERAALDADTITDESVLKELNAIIEGAETATQAAEEAEDAADRAEAAAQSLVIDQIPTHGSANAVSSGGVWDEIADLKSDLAESVRFDIEQNKTEEEKAQARANIGVGTANNELLWNIFYSCLHDVAWKTDKGLRVIEMVYDNLYKDIPENYTLLDYIESDSSKVVNTGILSQANLSIEMICSLVLKFYEHTSGGNTFNLRDFGPIAIAAGTNDPAGRFYLFGVVYGNYTSAGAYYDPYYGARYGNTTWSLSAERENAFHKHDLISVESIFSSSTYKLIVNNEVVVQGSVSNVNYGNSIYLFSNPYAFSTAEHTDCKSCRIYGINIKSNGIALFDGVPVYDKASGLGGLYDTIGKAFHPLTPLEDARM